MFKNSSLRFLSFSFFLLSANSCASTSVKWEGDMKKHVASYTRQFDDFRKKICVPKAESIFDKNLLAYRGQGYWIPELNEDVDVESIKSLLPEMEHKLKWIKAQKALVMRRGIPDKSVILKTQNTLKKLLDLKKTELSVNEKEKTRARQQSLALLTRLQKNYEALIKKVSFLTNFQYPVDHLKNRKVYDSFRDKDDDASTRIANYSFLYRKLLEDGAYNKDHTGSDIYLRTTIDTLHFELMNHGFYLSEDARYDADFVLSKIESELSKGKARILERLTEWEGRAQRTLDFYRSLTLPENQVASIKGDRSSTPNRQLIKEHYKATNRL